MPFRHQGQTTAIHWNSSVMCGVWVKTSGFDPKVDQILDIAVVGMTSHYEPEKKLLPFTFTFKPEPHLKPEPYVLKHSRMNRERLRQVWEQGKDWNYLAERFDEWFHKYLAMPDGKKIIPLSFNWPLVSPFLKYWLGPIHFNDYFAEQNRDLLAFCGGMNDMADFRSTPWPYEKLEWNYLCKLLEIQRTAKYYALNECIALINCYKEALRRGHLPH